MKKWIFCLGIASSNLFTPCEATWTNCIENQVCSPSQYCEPKNLNELRLYIRKATSEGQKIRVVGGGFSISDLVCTNGYLLNLKRLNQILSIDQKNALVHVQAGITLHELNEKLAEHGLALSNQAAIDHITLGGALASAVHGTGRTGTLSNFIKVIELMTADAEIRTLSSESDTDAISAAKVSLGALGVIYAVTIQCEPLFYLKSVEEKWDIHTLISKYQELNQSNDFFQFSWNLETDQVLVTRRNRIKAIDQNHFLNQEEVCYKVLACYQIDENDRDLFSEIAIPRDDLPKAIEKIRKFAKKYQAKGIKIADVVVRFVEADDQSYLSPSTNCPVAYLTMSIPFESDCPFFYKEFEELLLEDGGRPHWGKTNFLNYEKTVRLYGETLEKFIGVKQRLDPLGVFSNNYIDRICNKQ